MDKHNRTSKEGQNEKRTDSERFGIRSTPGLDPSDRYDGDPNTGPQGGMNAQGEGMTVKSDKDIKQTMENKPPRDTSDIGTLNGRESQRGMNQRGIDQGGRQGTANQHNG